MTSTARVGKRGEIVLRKAEREAAGIKPGDMVVISGRPGEIVIRKVPTLEEILSRPCKVKVSVNELKKLREDFRRELEERPSV